jgi:hypothetical protein
MKLIARAVTALALLAFATPALPCGDKAEKTTTASAETKTSKGAHAKQEKQKKAAQAKAEAQRPATAAN